MLFILETYYSYFIFIGLNCNRNFFLWLIYYDYYFFSYSTSMFFFLASGINLYAPINVHRGEWCVFIFCSKSSFSFVFRILRPPWTNCDLCNISNNWFCFHLTIGTTGLTLKTKRNLTLLLTWSVVCFNWVRLASDFGGDYQPYQINQVVAGVL